MSKDVPALGAAVAAALGEGWSRHTEIIYNDPGIVLRGPNDEVISISTGWHNGDRLEIRGWFRGGLREFKRYNEPRHEISVTVKKTAEQVARDITRRLLPGYREALTLARERKRLHEAATADLRQGEEEILARWAPARRAAHGNGELILGQYDDPVYAEATVLSSRVTFTVETSRTLAPLLAALLVDPARNEDSTGTQVRHTRDAGDRDDITILDAPAARRHAG